MSRPGRRATVLVSSRSLSMAQASYDCLVPSLARRQRSGCAVSHSCTEVWPQSHAPPARVRAAGWPPGRCAECRNPVPWSPGTPRLGTPRLCLHVADARSRAPVLHGCEGHRSWASRQPGSWPPRTRSCNCRCWPQPSLRVAARRDAERRKLSSPSAERGWICSSAAPAATQACPSRAMPSAVSGKAGR
jgi:hypothetical protein